MKKMYTEVSFDEWRTRAATSEIAERQSCAQGMRRDEAAVRAAITRPWSNGHVEGQINRRKLIKRMGDDRANVDLLRQRVLAA